MSLFQYDEVGREDLPTLEVSENEVECGFCEIMFVPVDLEYFHEYLCPDCTDYLSADWEMGREEW